MASAFLGYLEFVRPLSTARNLVPFSADMNTIRLGPPAYVRGFTLASV